MKYLLDTNICIHFFKGQFGLNDKIRKIGFENCLISEITLAELFYGAEKSENKVKNSSVVEDFAGKIISIPISKAIRVYAKEKARLKKKGTIISDLDLLIGATAIANNLILVTRNLKEFDRMNDIILENWIDN